MNNYFGALTFGLPAGFPVGAPATVCGLTGIVNSTIQSAGTATSGSATPVAGITFDGGYDTYYGSGTASAQYGIVSAGVTTTVDGISGSGTAETVGYAIASDTLDFTCPTCVAGATGSVVLHFTMSGSLTMDYPNFGEAAAEVVGQVGTALQPIFYYVNSEGGGSVEANGSPNVSTACSSVTSLTGSGSLANSGFSCTNVALQTVMLPVTYGAMTTIGVGLYVGADPFGEGTTIDPGGALSGITLYDSFGHEISNFSITSGSGAVYGANGIESQPASSSVPEPSSVILLPIMLLGVAFLARKRMAQGL
jgi:hypothetical protein